MTKVRCAIYTRKSTDEGLEQEFNSLDAQHDACKAYVASQKHEGWSLNHDRYDDGGFSGGSMDRPGLKALLEDVRTGKVDVIIIYKIDRLTRSLADFARIIEALEKSGASFVSVTQSFNTKTSMGRLMLHVLLSFAQFEREVGAERVRDKIAASKAKGMWMGGTVPLGYDATDKKLIVNEAEAETVREIFEDFDRLKSVQATLRLVREQGLATKRRQRNGKVIGGALFHYGALRCVLSNRTYVGEVEHKDRIYPGQHAPIIGRDLFERVQQALANLSTDATRRPKLVSASLLQGLIADRQGRCMGPVHSTRNGQRFRYYVTHWKAVSSDGARPYRMPADELERLCCALLAEGFQRDVRSIENDAEAKCVAELLRTGPQRERREFIVDQVRRVVVGDAELTIELTNGSTLQRSVERIRHGNDAKLVIGEDCNANQLKPNPQLLLLLRNAQRARALTLAKPNLPLEKLAAEFGRCAERFKRLLRLSYLSPAVVTAIIESRQPACITNRYLQNLDGLPWSWAEQDQLLLA